MSNRMMTDGKSRLKRRSGVPTGNAGEYFVMGELLRRGFDAQLADRNTAGYDVLVGSHNDQQLTKVQIKSVRAAPWFVRKSNFEGALLDQITIYVLLGKEDACDRVRYFIVKNSDVADQLATPASWKTNALMRMRSVAEFEDRWDRLKGPASPATLSQVAA